VESTGIEASIEKEVKARRRSRECREISCNQEVERGGAEAEAECGRRRSGGGRVCQTKERHGGSRLEDGEEEKSPGERNGKEELGRGREVGPGKGGEDLEGERSVHSAVR
jgi:hypothetical protein